LTGMLDLDRLARDERGPSDGHRVAAVLCKRLRRRAADGEAKRGGARRRAAARCGYGVRIPQTARDLHRDDREHKANPLATLPGGDGDGRRRTASRGGG
jgi:hypothetical protein